MPQEPVSERTPIFRNIHISNLTGTEVDTAIKILGIEEMPVYDVTLNNINIRSKSGMEVDRVRNLELNNVRIDAQSGSPFKISHAENVILNGIRTETPDASSPLIKISDSKECLIQGCYPQAGSKSFIQLDGNNQEIILMNNYLKRLSVVVDPESKSASQSLIIKE